MIAKTKTPQRTEARATASSARRRSLAIVLSLALLTRLLAAWSFIATHPHTYLFSHPYEMGLVADSLIHGHGYSSPFGGSTGPTAIVAPGYPTIIAAVFFLFGSFTFASALTIIGLQILISLVAIWIMMHIARQVLDHSTAIVAGAFWAVSLPLLWLPTIFWETSLSACSFVAILALAIHTSRRPRAASWVILGSCCAIASLINPALLPSLVAIMAWVAWRSRVTAHPTTADSTHAPAHPASAPLLGLLALIVVFAAWPIRNAVRFHAFIPLRSTVGLEMYMGNHPGATGRLDDSLFPLFNHQEMSAYLQQGEVAYTRGKSAQASAYIRSHPAAFFKMTLRRIVRFWAGTGNVDGPPIYAIHALLTTLFGALGLALLFRRRRAPFAVLMALPLLLFPLPYYITHAEFRYRLNIDPILTILAAYAVTQIVSVWRQRYSLQSSPNTPTDR